PLPHHRSLDQTIRPPPRTTLFPYTRSSDLSPSTNSAAATPERPPRTGSARRATGSVTVGPATERTTPDRILRHGRDRRLDLRCRSEETRLNSSHVKISYAVFCLKKKTYTQH